MGEAMCFTLYIGAAVADATVEQRQRLQAEIAPLLNDYQRTGNEASVRSVVSAVMPQGWSPSGDWAVQIEALS